MSLTRAAFLMLVAPAVALRHRKNNTEAQGYFVTMGDSYSSGQGIHKRQADYHEGHICSREFKTTPGGQLSQNEGLPHLMPACGGDELPGIKEQLTKLLDDYPAETAAGWPGSTFMLTIGGNDIRSNDGGNWPSILAGCIASFSNNCHTKHQNQVANFAEVEAELAEFYHRLAQSASNAVIRIWGYPRLLQRTWAGCIPIPGVSKGACQWMDDMVDELNGHVSAAVQIAKGRNPSVDLEFVDVRTYFTKGACTTSGNQIHGIVLNSPMIFHPSQRGYNAFYEALANSLGRGLPPSGVYPGPPEPWDVEGIFKGWDASNSGSLSLDEVIDMGGDEADPTVTRKMRRLFAEADANHDGVLDLGEFRIFLSLVERERA